ncbi:DUF2461 domain-containing protein [Rhodopirellula sp. MGV]|uniref:DUF2461 domain-containing protein n=1 Tax=Rhodopirellula sp. MGV TaxID=2023130 RepID=UPI000B970269|nr:DUF2461 domain-containing protein [Rhodopirellula sp. MGV]OYP38065.1 TIGR02453 family protein [Rhodopirellula sp. MGV]PNY35225.1 DUF2461 domain-containing protein [Rhodopirellula baltica]
MGKAIIDKSLFEFLEDLKQNNDRDWFAENKTRYQTDVLAPAVELVAQLEKPLAKAAPMLHVVPKGHNGSVLRIYRDTRFSKDKLPYKTNVGISFRHQAGKDIHAPGAYVHLDTDECFVAAGCWRPAGDALTAIRAAIDSDPKAWKRARDQKAFTEHFQLVGESLKTAPRDYPKDHPLIEDLRRKDFIAISPLSRKEVTSDAIVPLIVQRIKQARPLMRFLCDAVGVPY